MSKTIVAELSGAVKIYDGRRVVDGVDLELASGETTVLVGPNGSGKTTTMEMLVGLRRLTQGNATIAGHPVRIGGDHRLYTGVQLQSSGLPSKIKVAEVIRSVECLYAEPADWRTLAASLGVDAYLSATVDNLSGGQRRRLDILCAALGRPKLLVLDEPTSGIDPEGRAMVWDFVRSLSKEGCAVLASTHDMSEAEAFADKLLVMAAGKIRLSGSVDEVLTALEGNRRFRIVGPSASILDAVSASGHPFGISGNSVVVVGNQEQLKALRAELGSISDSQTVDFLEGPIRLEDIFAVIMSRLELSSSGQDPARAAGQPKAQRQGRLT